mmetsp:Transcript_29297/g.58614  ORF Transcript_29297/g.58614 Transcript_29297/m.58614 type:complete len:111 (+) Transcript_29297:2973-3305(+)
MNLSHTIDWRLLFQTNMFSAKVQQSINSKRVIRTRSEIYLNSSQITQYIKWIPCHQQCNSHHQGSALAHRNRYNFAVRESSNCQRNSICCPLRNSQQDNSGKGASHSRLS